jgi:hypothetical protein
LKWILLLLLLLIIVADTEHGVALSQFHLQAQITHLSNLESPNPKPNQSPPISLPPLPSLTPLKVPNPIPAFPLVSTLAGSYRPVESPQLKTLFPILLLFSIHYLN